MFYKSGQLHFRGKHKNGKKEELWQRYYKNGQLSKKEERLRDEKFYRKYSEEWSDISFEVVDKSLIDLRVFTQLPLL